MTTFPFGNYSTSEVDTGFTWINGKPIYKITVNFGSLPNNTNKDVNHGITYEYVIDYQFTIINSSSTVGKLPFVSDSGSAAASGSIAVTIRPTFIRVNAFSDRTGFSGYCTLYYTKP